MKVIIDQEIKSIALSHSIERMKYEYDRFKLNENQRKSMIIIGTLGQLAFKKLLEVNDVKFNFEFQAGKYDELDFELGGDIVEIKSSGYEHSFLHLNLLYSEDQLSRGLYKNFKYCVIIFLNGYNKLSKTIDIDLCTEAIIYGFIEFEDIKKYKQVRQFYGDDYKVPLTKLKDITELINKYKNEQN